MRKLSFRNLSVEHIWSLTALVGIFMFVNTHPIRPHDFWWHMAVGREIVHTGVIPAVDVYSYTVPGQPYPSYQMFWLMEVGLYLVYNFGGPALVVFFQGAIITTAYSIILLLCWHISRSWRVAAFGALFAAALGINDWNVRPQVITFFLGSIFLYAIYQYRKNPRFRWLFAFPTGMLVWVNSHGTFPLGLALLVCWFADEVWQVLEGYYNKRGEVDLMPLLPPVISLVLSVLACTINPRGFGIISYIQTLTGNTVVQALVPEWAPPNLDSLLGVLFYAGLLLSATILAISPRRPNFLQMALFLGFAILGIKTSRGIIWFGIVMAPVLAEHVSALAKKLFASNETSDVSAGSSWLNITFTVLLLTMGLISLPWFKDALPLPKEKAGLVSSETPIEATNFLMSEHLPTPVFHAMPFGSYLIWAAQPEYKVFVDSRIELYPLEIWKDYLEISNAQCGWEERLAFYDVRTLMLSPNEQPALVSAAQDSGRWKLVYQDTFVVIFVRNTIP